MQEIVNGEMKKRMQEMPPFNEKYINWQRMKKNEREREYRPFPQQEQRKLTLAIISGKPNSDRTCAIMNAVNIFTHLSMNTIKSLLGEGLSKVAVILDSSDQMSKEFLQRPYKDSITFVQVDLPDS